MTQVELLTPRFVATGPTIATGVHLWGCGEGEHAEAACMRRWGLRGKWTAHGHGALRGSAGALEADGGWACLQVVR